MALEKYKKKRDFSKTTEPEGAVEQNAETLHFVVQKHQASRLHYDFRLELDGVLKSWAVPKGPSLNPKDKRLAMMVEDHPVSYMKFEGVIPPGNYGAGNVIVWDYGVYMSAENTDHAENEKILRKGLEKGELKIALWGEKLKGVFGLIRMKGQTSENAWLLVKDRDEYSSEEDITMRDKSVLSGETLPQENPSKYSAIQKSDKMPTDIKPMLAKQSAAPFDKKGWIFEPKWDGYRAIALLDKGTVRLYSRNGISFNESYPTIVEELENISDRYVLDGEIVAFKNGKPDFHSLQQYAKSPTDVRYMLFDILYADGINLMESPLRERKMILTKILPKLPLVALTKFDEEHGIAFFKRMQKEGHEGMVAKDLNSTYREGQRSSAWLKFKIRKQQEAIILGYTAPRSGRHFFGALVLGAYENGKLVYIGHSGGGFTDRELADIASKLEKVRTEKPPVNPATVKGGWRGDPPTAITWVKPKYVCEVKYTEWTPERVMRHPIYAGMRLDKSPVDVVREQIASVRKARPSLAKETKAIRFLEADMKDQKFTNLEKIFWEDEGYTKGDVIDYYEKMANTILPYLLDRPQNLNRHPNGIDGKSFYHKNIEMELPPFVRTKSIWSESNKKELRYLLCQNKATLLYLANLGCIEINPWNSRVAHLDKPDYMILDLDPGGNTFDDLIIVAKEVRKVLELACLENYIKTSGKTGFHIFVPLQAKYPYDDVRTFAELIVTIVNKRLPSLTSIERNPKKRGGKIYLDHLQNRRGQTIAAPYSLRPYKGATVSTPLRWSEIKKGLNPRKFNIRTIFKRLDKQGDLWQNVLKREVDLRESIACLQKEVRELNPTPVKR